LKHSVYRITTLLAFLSLLLTC